jgi:hypothetical protein
MSLAKQRIYEIAHQHANPDIAWLDEAEIRGRFFFPEPLQFTSPRLNDLAIGARLEHTIAFLLLMNSIDFQHWQLLPSGGHVKFQAYQRLGHTGSDGVRIALLDAWGDGATHELFQERLGTHGIEPIFGDISEPAAREANLKCVLKDDGRTLVEMSAELAAATRAGSLTTDHAARIEAAFPEAYGDAYLVRAQKVLLLIAGHLASQGQPTHLNITTLADNESVRVLRARGFINCTRELVEHIDSGRLIPMNTAEEQALRSAVVLTGLRLAERMGDGFTETAVVNYVDSLREGLLNRPVHLTMTRDY